MSSWGKCPRGCRTSLIPKSIKLATKTAQERSGPLSRGEIVFILSTVLKQILSSCEFRWKKCKRSHDFVLFNCEQSHISHAQLPMFRSEILYTHSLKMHLQFPNKHHQIMHFIIDFDESGYKTVAAERLSMSILQT